ncbi:hypothetical protein [Sulfurovum sp.]|uniref:hypothetical protein n=1 Tax=Sulfurovum sp. TaxID=1969726 RepID=UPI0025F4709E|nr:hypothetical protein [Sulfurovum sp.]
MSTFSTVKTGVLLLCFGTYSLFASADTFKKYEVQSGSVVYSISGEGVLAPDLNITISGEGKLRFRDWGKIALAEEKIEEDTYGAFLDREQISTCVKRDRNQQFSVNYDRKVIMQRSLPQGKKSADLSHMHRSMSRQGQETVAGKVCTVWAKKNVRMCFYKGIPLLIEKEAVGIHYEKRAVEFKENVKVSTDNCSMPNFPVQKFALFKTTIKQKKSADGFFQLLSEIIDKTSKMKSTQVQKRKQIYLNRLGEHIFAKQKILLPQMLDSMKRARECLQGADNNLEANDCIEEINDFRSKIVKEDENTIDTWDKKAKDSIVDEFDANIARLESRMPCIRASKNIADLSGCMSK